MSPSRGAVPSPMAEKTVDAIPKTRVTDAGSPHPDASEIRASELLPSAPSTNLPLALASALPNEEDRKRARQPAPKPTRSRPARRTCIARNFKPGWSPVRHPRQGALREAADAPRRRIGLGVRGPKSSLASSFRERVATTFSIKPCARRSPTSNRAGPNCQPLRPCTRDAAEFAPVGFSCTIASRCRSACPRALRRSSSPPRFRSRWRDWGWQNRRRPQVQPAPRRPTRAF